MISTFVDSSCGSVVGTENGCDSDLSLEQQVPQSRLSGSCYVVNRTSLSNDKEYLKKNAPKLKKRGSGIPTRDDGDRNARVAFESNGNSGKQNKSDGAGATGKFAFHRPTSLDLGAASAGF